MNDLVKTTDFSSIIEEYLDQKDVGEKSLKIYRSVLRLFFAWVNLQVLPDGKLTKKHILDYKKKLMDEGKSPYTTSLYLASIRGFFDWAEEEGMYKNIARRVKGAKVGNGFRKEPLTGEQAHALILNATNQRDLALFWLMVGTGLRTIEVSRANFEDVRNKGHKTVLDIQGKGHDSKDEIVILQGPVLEELRKYLSARKAVLGEPLFTSESRYKHGSRLTAGSISRIVKTALRGIHIDDPRITAHSLRHSAITFVGLAGGSQRDQQTVGRHVSIDTTAKYAHDQDRLESNPEAKILEYMGVTA